MHGCSYSISRRARVEQVAATEPQDTGRALLRFVRLFALELHEEFACSFLRAAEQRGHVVRTFAAEQNVVLCTPSKTAVQTARW